MKVLVACEFSGIVREAFRRRGHSAYSCDLLPAEDGSSFHYQGNAKIIAERFNWDLILAFPPCTHLAVSGARWFKEKQEEQQQAKEFFLFWTKFERCAIENPIGIMNTCYRKPDQIIQPWMFGHPETKSTCLWLRNLLKLIPTKDVKNEMLTLPKSKANRVHYASPSPDRWKERSRTLLGIADAMAEQWGNE